MCTYKTEFSFSFAIIRRGTSVDAGRIGRGGANAVQGTMNPAYVEIGTGNHVKCGRLLLSSVA